jgi:hypothetical protein
VLQVCVLSGLYQVCLIAFNFRTSLLDNPDLTLRFRCPVCKMDQFPDSLEVAVALRAEVGEFVRGLGGEKRGREGVDDGPSPKKEKN